MSLVYEKTFHVLVYYWNCVHFRRFFFMLIDKISLRVKSSSCFFCIIKSTSFNFNLDPKNGIVDSIPSLCSLSGGHDTIERSR